MGPIPYLGILFIGPPTVLGAVGPIFELGISAD